MTVWIRNLKRMREYPSAIIGLVIIAILAMLSLITVFKIPYGEAARLWRGGEIWENSPKNASPLWFDWFDRQALPRTIVVDGADETVPRSITTGAGDTTEISTTLAFDYPYDGFPPEMTLYLDSTYATRRPHVSLTWVTPDGREIRVSEVTPKQSDSYRFTQDKTLKRRLRSATVEQGLFDDPAVEGVAPLKGRYQLRVKGRLFEKDSSLTAKLVVYGKVHGWAGTDHMRRDLLIALLWGTPVAMSFGLLAATITTFTTMSIAAFGVWNGGIVDSLIQRVCEVNMILPMLPILIMVGTFYKRSLPVMLAVVIALSLFGAAIKSYRAIFLQVRTMPYVEAAQAYGASDRRIIFRYLVPRVLPMTIPNLVITVPAFVFLEASLAVLGLGDPVLPTWGKVIQNANEEGALFNGYYYWILEPAVLLMLAGLAFAMVGFALDRVFNPRLREL